MKTFGKALIGGVLTMAVGSALAVPITSTNAARPAGGVFIGNTTDAPGLCPGYANCELQSILDVVSGNTLNAANNQTNQAMFSIGPPPFQVAAPLFIIEVTANAASQVFGIFSDADGLAETAGDRSFAPIFGGANSNGDTFTVKFDFAANTVQIGGNLGPVFGGITASSFGFYLQPSANSPILYSSDVMNPGNGTQFVAYNYSNGLRWILGFEDVFRTANASQCNQVTFSSSDCDHNDIIVTIESIVPRVPEPGSLALLGLGLLGLGASARRRSKS